MNTDNRNIGYGLNLFTDLGKLVFFHYIHKFEGHFNTDNLVIAVNRIMEMDEGIRSEVLKEIEAIEHNTRCQCSKKLLEDWHVDYKKKMEKILHQKQQRKGE